MDDDFFGGFEVSDESSSAEPEAEAAAEPEAAAADGGSSGNAAGGGGSGLTAVSDAFELVTTPNEKAQLGCVYAALILNDDGVEITAEKLTALLKAANLDVNPFWTTRFARVLKNRDLNDLIMSGIGGGSSRRPRSGPCP